MRVRNEMMIREHPRGLGMRQNLPTPAPLPQPPSCGRAVRYHSCRRWAAGSLLAYIAGLILALAEGHCCPCNPSSEGTQLLRTNSRCDRTRDPVMLSTDSLAEVPSRTIYVFAAEADAGADELG